MGEKNQLRDACEYALLSPGKRLRPQLVLMVAEAIGKKNNVMPVALGVECFHAASLIADDLPCMDNDDVRRNRPSLHKAFGESVAILASYALIAEGYGSIYRNHRLHPEVEAMVCLEAATRCAGMNGATNGQFLDLYPPDRSLETIQKVMFQKTATLFEISFLFGWVFGGGRPESLPEVRKCAYHLGMAFQIADDLADEGQDEFSLLHVLGKEKAICLLQEEIASFIELLKSLKLWNGSFQQVVQTLASTSGFLAAANFA
jgi:geranylgeranyl diphosphate synthase type II